MYELFNGRVFPLYLGDDHNDYEAKEELLLEESFSRGRNPYFVSSRHEQTADFRGDDLRSLCVQTIGRSDR